MRKTLRSVSREVIEECLERGTEVGVDHMITVARTRHSDLFATESERLLMQALRREFKSLLDDMSKTSEQLVIPGINLPAALALPRDGKVKYKRIDKANWSDLVLGRAVRYQHIVASQASLDEYDRSMEHLAPIMKQDPDILVGDAIRELAKKTAA